MTAFSWSLEFITGLTLLGVTLTVHDPESNVDIIAFLVIVDGILNFVVIPSTYILNNQDIKALIIAGGWGKLFRLQNRAYEDNSRQNRLPVPIPTVSGNIQAIANPKKDVKEVSKRT